MPAIRRDTFGGFSLGQTFVALLQIQKHRVLPHPNVQKIKFLIIIIPPVSTGGITFVVENKLFGNDYRDCRICGAV